MVHVSQLKRHVDAAVEVSTELPESNSDTDQSIAPIQFLDSRMVIKGATAMNQIRVAWSGMPSMFSTWEVINDLRRRYPSTPAWGQAGFCGGGNVMHRRKALKAGG